MSGDGLPSRTFLPPTDAVGSGTPLQTSELVSVRIGTIGDAVQIEQAALPQVQLRKIAPGTEHAPVFHPQPEAKAPSFLDRITSVLRPGGAAPETALVRFVQKPDQPTDFSDKTENLSDAIDRLEKSQQFATGTTLVSSLTQSVMSSSKRLTQGQ
ncbi:hypothetical protein [Rhizobium giardinii]|uniref:Uncharacterized protein n=1 Tax=Rhizobium giardinii TaxID=56731 RepID=A0A7W8UBX9_9HYPH|nr:hypothetical protein [Rhizobium giardinii]MBB5536473.1 hypothetical protein [Rhizobium giardinii]